MKNKLQKITLAISLLSLISSEEAYAMIVHDPISYVQTLATAKNTAQQLLTEAEQLKTALNDSKNYDGNVGQWGDIQKLLQRLGQEVQQGQALAYNMPNLNQEFMQKFPGFTSATDYPKAYKDWSQTSLDTLRGTLSSVGLQANQFENEQARLNTLSKLSKSATGRMQAVQVGNMLATEQVTQLQQLRQLVAAQVDAQNTYAAAQIQQQANTEAATENWINQGDTTFPVYGKK